ncbi:hypothetical protein An14g04550 [Aspergillus niger]|uniref:Uncharacterized protein n=2 Tax=Aspergillus niger TaxID=5061 RepID=A2R3J9_ASPNC|nr:hypothetical protein An14g04550 [Aspergillus niger]CAK42017.1 hypothetical protein An14g04550 [Aspergillus niger]
MKSPSSYCVDTASLNPHDGHDVKNSLGKSVVHISTYAALTASSGASTAYMALELEFHDEAVFDVITVGMPRVAI